MKQLTNTLDNLMVDMMVRCMTNPDNHDFYLPELTLEKVEDFFNSIQDSTVSEIFWKAFGIAQNSLPEIVNVSEYEQLSMFNDDVCPECGCPNYIPGVRCPNCDYVE